MEKPIYSITLEKLANELSLEEIYSPIGPYLLLTSFLDALPRRRPQHLQVR